MNDVKETNEGHEEKEPQDKGKPKESCGCGCESPVETK